MISALYRELNVVNFNVQGVTSKIDFIKALNGSSDLVSLTEHWLTNTQLCQLNFEPFTVIANFCRSNHIRGGSCILLKTDLKLVVLERPDLCVRNSEFHFELSAVEIVCLNLIVLCVYRSPNKGDKTVFTDNLQWVSDSAFKEGKSIILAGDFNFNLLLNSDRAVLTDLLSPYALSQTIFEPTRISAMSVTCIDNVFTNLKFDNVKVFETGISDHAAQRLTVHLNILDKNCLTPPVYQRNITDASVNRLINCLSIVDWSFIYNTYDVNQMFEYFLSRFICLYDMSCPKTVKKPKKSKINGHPKLNVLYSKLSDISFQLRCCKDNSLKALLRKKHKTVKKLIFQTIKEINDQQIKSSSNVSGNAWKVINSYASVKTASSKLKNLIVDNEKVTDFTDIADHLSNHFSNLPTPNSSNLCAIDILRKCSKKLMHLFRTAYFQIVLNPMMSYLFIRKAHQRALQIGELFPLLLLFLSFSKNVFVTAYKDFSLETMYSVLSNLALERVLARLMPCFLLCQIYMRGLIKDILWEAYFVTLLGHLRWYLTMFYLRN